jgi:hypothetical protein
MTSVKDVGGAYIYHALVWKHGKKEADRLMRELWTRREKEWVKDES